MDFFDNSEELQSTLTPIEKDQLKSLFLLINEIKSNSAAKPNAYIHLLLREKYFLLIQSVVESCSNALVIKYVFSILQKFLLSESACDLCAIKEKSQFLLNILRFIQHTHINDEIIKLEVFKLLLSNYEAIQLILTSKALTSLLEIAMNEFESSTNSSTSIIQSTSKAIVIKYISIVCEQISKQKKRKDSLKSEDLSSELERESFDSYLVNLFAALLNRFNQDLNENSSSYELRALILECIELLLNNLQSEHVDASTSYNIRKNGKFIKFAWQQFCPSILFQFGDCGLPSKESAPQSINFKQVYTILMQLTGLIGGCKSMISVFEAIYQRILFYTPELDRTLLLKLFKTFVDEKFIMSITLVENDATTETNKKNSTSISSSDEIVYDFSLINLIIGFYRNCYEKSIKQPENKLLQLLSCECIQSFVDIIHALFKRNEFSSSEIPELILNKSVINKKLVKQMIESTKMLDQETHKLIEEEALNYYEKFSKWLVDLVTNKYETENLNLDFELKKFCLSLLKTQEQSTSIFPISCHKLYATTYFSLYKIFKSSSLINKTLNLTNFKYDKRTQSHKEYFIYRILTYSGIDDLANKKNDMKMYLKIWLSFIYDHLNDFSDKESAIGDFLSNYDNYGLKLELKLQINFILKQMDCLTKVHLRQATNAHNDNSKNNLDLIKKLLKSSWPYLTDVLTGLILNTNLECIENILLKNELLTGDQILKSSDLVNSNSLTDLSLVLFSYKYCIDSLEALIKIVAYVESMDKELNQLFFLLVSNPFKQTFTNDNINKTSLNHIICIDFVINSILNLICESEDKYRNLQSRNNASYEILWKHLVETMFFCFYLQTNMNDEIKLSHLNSQDSELNKENSLLFYKFKRAGNSEFRSVYSNLNDLDDKSIETNLFPHSSSIDSSLLETNKPNVMMTSSKFLNQQRKLIYKDLFLFLNKKINYVDLDSETIQAISKIDLINLISQHIYDHLFNDLIVKVNDYISNKKIKRNLELDLFDFIWQLINNLCKFSKRYLLTEIKLRNKHEYFTFNNLIIDKIEELVLKLIGKLTIEIDNKNISNANLNISSLLMQSSSLNSTNSNLTILSTYSLYSIFLNEIWLNLFMPYFMSLCLKCGLERENKRLSNKYCDSENYQSKSSKISQYLRQKAANLKSSYNKNRKPESIDNDSISTNINETNEFLIDFSICKKLVNIVQKVFELYNFNSDNYNIMAAKHAQFDFKIKEDQTALSVTSSSSTPNNESPSTPDFNDLISNNEFLIRLEKSKKNLVSSSSSNERISSQLLHMATTSMIMPSCTPTNEQIEIYLIDEYLNFNTLFLLPFRSLMLKNYLNSCLKDAIISSIYELVESSSYKIKNSWNCLFTCMSKVDLNMMHLNKSRKVKKNKRASLRMRKKQTRKYLKSKISSNPIHLEKLRLKSADSDVSSDFAKSFESFTSHFSDNSSYQTSSISESIDGEDLVFDTASSSLSFSLPSDDESLSPVISHDGDSLAEFNSHHHHQSREDTNDAENLGQQRSTDDESSSSSRSQSSHTTLTNLTFRNISFKFDSYRIRLNSLIDIFNIYLSISSNSNYILESGTFEFIKCITNYLQYSTSLNSNKLFQLDNQIDLFELEFSKTPSPEQEINNHNVNDEEETNDTNKEAIEPEDGEDDVYLSATDYYQITSNYDYLAELSAANNSNTLVKPFLVCIEKLFNILAKKFDYLSSEENSDSNSSNNLIDKKVFKLSDYKIKRLKAHKMVSFQFLCESVLNNFDLSDVKNNENLFQIESDADFNNLQILFDDYLLKNDSKNMFKIFAYLIESLFARIFILFDELNCVQLVEFIFNLMLKLINLKQHVLVSYCVLEIFLKNINKVIDLVESKSTKIKDLKHFISKKLYQNTFFISNLLEKLIEKTLDLIATLSIHSESKISTSFLVCIQSRLTFVLVKSLIRKLNRFDSILDLRFMKSARDLILKAYENLLNLNDANLSSKCIDSIKLFHLLSLLPVKTILSQKINNSNGDLNKNLVENFEVLTKKSQNSWQLHNLKKAYETAKGLLYYEHQNQITLEINNEANNNLNRVYLEAQVDEEDDNQFKHSIDDKNIYRDFTLKFHDKKMTSDFNEKKKEMFSENQEEAKLTNEINLTSFINLTRFHFDLLAIIGSLSSRNHRSDHSFDLLSCLNKTYISSLKLDYLLSFKIILSKIFYLNCDSSLANFINLTSESFSAISSVLFKLVNCPNGHNFELNADHVVMNLIEKRRLNENKQDEQMIDEKLIRMLENQIETYEINEAAINEYFNSFIHHLNLYYLYLNEKSHNFRLQRSYLIKTIKGDQIEINNHQPVEDSEKESDNERVDKKVLILFKLHKQQNKALTMFNLTKKTEMNRKDADTVDKESSSSSVRNEMVYFQRDCRFRYQIWSNELVARFLVSLGSEKNLENLIVLYSEDKNMLNSLAEIIVVFNSCSSYCQCSALAENDTNSTIELKNLKDTSAKLLASLLQKLNN